MLSGFSQNMLKLFLEGQGQDIDIKEDPAAQPAAQKERKVITPEEIMLKALGHESYANLKVLD